MLLDKKFLTLIKIFDIIIIEKMKGGFQVSFDEVLQNAIEVIHDTCISYEGKCEKCALLNFCQSLARAQKPGDYEQ